MPGQMLGVQFVMALLFLVRGRRGFCLWAGQHQPATLMTTTMCCRTFWSSLIFLPLIRLAGLQSGG